MHYKKKNYLHKELFILLRPAILGQLIIEIANVNCSY